MQHPKVTQALLLREYGTCPSWPSWQPEQFEPTEGEREHFSFWRLAADDGWRAWRNPSKRASTCQW